MSAFEEFGLMPELIQALEDMQWTLPKPCQQEAIPMMLGGGDVLCAAETGSGKTGAFCLPIIQSTWEALNNVIDPEARKKALGTCKLNKDDCVDVMVSGDGYSCESDKPVWVGGRANYGIKSGQYYYEVTITGNNNTVRVGWSTIKASRDLGQDRLGFGYSSGKKAFSRQFDTYGDNFSKGDVIGCLLDRAEKGTIRFMLNGKDLGVAFQNLATEEALYPAFSFKQSGLNFNFGQKKWDFPPPAGFLAVDSLKDNIQAQEKLYKKFLRTKRQEASGVGNLPTALIVEPTLELAQQVAQEIESFTKYMDDIHWSVCVGKKDNTTILKELEDANIVIGTPGKLMSLVDTRCLKLDGIKFFVLDEADRISADNKDIIMNIYAGIVRTRRELAQVCMFSATLHSPEITWLYKQICPRATWIDLKGVDYVPETVHHGIIRVDPNDPSLIQSPEVDYEDDKVHENDFMGSSNARELRQSRIIKRIKPEMVAKLIDAYSMEQCIVFCRTRLDCDNLSRFLIRRGKQKENEAKEAISNKTSAPIKPVTSAPGAPLFTGKTDKGKENPYSNVCLHSGFSPAQRRENLESFKEGDVRLLISTDVAARGIDVKELPYVINVTLPDKDEDYVHRVGRVGRADRMGLAVSIVAVEKEKVWYHKCPSRGEGCKNTELVDRGGCCIWYNEIELLRNIEKRIGAIPEMCGDYRHPAHSELAKDQPIVYGKSKDEAKKTVSDHIVSIMDAVSKLESQEVDVQDIYHQIPGAIAALFKNRKAAAVSKKAPKAPAEVSNKPQAKKSK